MRIKLVPEAQVSADQKSLYDAFVASVREKFSSFKSIDEQGALLGPWAVWLQVPKVGEAVRKLIEQIEGMPGLEPKTIQAIILATGAHFDATYELYAHSVMGEASGLTSSQVAALAADVIPNDLGKKANLAVQIVKKLLAGGPLPGAVYDEAVRVLGRDGFNHLIFIVSQYCLVSVCLNAYAMPGDYEYDSDTDRAETVRDVG